MPRITRPWAGVVWARAAAIAAPALLAHLRRRARIGKEIITRLPERQGKEVTHRPFGLVIWLHAASVGEAVSILPVLRQAAMAERGATLLLTTGTVTSAELMTQRLEELGLTHRVVHRFVPLDVPSWIERFLDHWRPDAGGLVESELWPNLLHACRTRCIPMMLINARMSARSHRAWRHAPALARYLLTSFARIHARGAEDAGRLRNLGASVIDEWGDLKVTAAPLPVDDTALAHLRAMLGDRPVWLAASTHPGEEILIAGAHRRLAVNYPRLLTIIVPRHPERGPAIAAELSAPRRAAGEPPPSEGIWIADTIGELGLWYRVAWAAVIGRSLIAPGGGQNPWEAARIGCPIIVGPHMTNFAEPVALLRDAGGLLEAHDEESLALAAGELLGDATARNSQAARAALALGDNTELPARIARALLTLAGRR